MAEADTQGGRTSPTRVAPNPNAPPPQHDESTSKFLAESLLTANDPTGKLRTWLQKQGITPLGFTKILESYLKRFEAAVEPPGLSGTNTEALKSIASEIRALGDADIASAVMNSLNRNYITKHDMSMRERVDREMGGLLENTMGLNRDDAQDEMFEAFGWAKKQHGEDIGKVMAGGLRDENSSAYEVLYKDSITGDPELFLNIGRTAGAISPTPTTGGGETPSDKPTYFPESTPEGPYQGDFGGMGYTAEEKEKYGIPLSPEEFDELERKGKEEGSLPQSTAPAPTPTPTDTPTGTPTEKTNPLEQGYYFGYGGAGEKGSELAQSDQATLGQDSYILGQSSGLTHRGKTELPPAPFQQRSGAARRARIRQGQWDIAAPKREFLRGQARAVRGATDIATQELLKRTGKTADEIRALKDTDPEQFERLRAERDMHMQNLVNPDRPQFKAEDLGKVMEGGKWTGAYAPETALMEARKFREKHVEKAFTPEKAKKAGEWTRKLVRDSRLEDAGEAAYQKAIQEGGGAYQGDFGGMGYTAEEKEKYGIPLSEADKARKAAIAAASHDIDTASRKAAETREKAMGQVKIFRDAAGKVVGFSKPSGYKTDKEGKRTFDPFAAVSEEKVGEAGKDVKRFVKEGQQIRRSKLLDQLAKSGYLEGTPKVSTGARPRFTPEGVLKAPFGPKGTPLPTPPTLPEEVRSYFPEQQKTTPTPATKPTTPKKKKARGRFGAGR